MIAVVDDELGEAYTFGCAFRLGKVVNLRSCCSELPGFDEIIDSRLLKWDQLRNWSTSISDDEVLAAHDLGYDFGCVLFQLANSN